MALTEAQRRANDKYIKENYQKLSVSYPKEFCEQVRQAAKENGESLAAYVRKAIESRMNQPTQEQQEAKPTIPKAEAELFGWGADHDWVTGGFTEQPAKRPISYGSFTQEDWDDLPDELK